jgi:DNA-binding XRE family transcriptional regulator
MQSIKTDLTNCSPEEIRQKAEQLSRGKFIRARRRTGLTQARFADRVGCDRTTVGNAECGETRVPAWLIEAAEALASSGSKVPQ